MLKSWLYSTFSKNPASNRVIITHTGTSPEDRLLDIGCGPGAALEHALAAGADVAGVDPSPTMVARASRRIPAATIVEGSAEDLPFEDNTFSLVWTISAFHHWADPGTGIDEVKRVLRPNGRFHIVERKLKSGKEGHGLTVADAKAWAEKLSENGFAEAGVDEMRAGRSDYVVITGIA